MDCQTNNYIIYSVYKEEKENTQENFWSHKLYQLFDYRSASILVKFWKLQWVCRIDQMCKTKIPKRVLKGRVHCKRPKEKTEKGWKDLTDADYRFFLRFRKWKVRSSDRDNWRVYITVGKIRFQSQRRRRKNIMLLQIASFTISCLLTSTKSLITTLVI